MPTAGKLTVCILEAKNLKKMDVGGLSGTCRASGCHWVAPANRSGPRAQGVLHTIRGALSHPGTHRPSQQVWVLRADHLVPRPLPFSTGALCSPCRPPCALLSIWAVEEKIREILSPRCVSDRILLLPGNCRKLSPKRASPSQSGTPLQEGSAGFTLERAWGSTGSVGWRNVPPLLSLPENQRCIWAPMSMPCCQPCTHTPAV